MFRNERPPGSEIVDNYEEVIFEDETQGVFAWMMDGALARWKELRVVLNTNRYQGIKNGILAIAWTNGYTIFRFGGWPW
jgi:hypothetical protein